VRPLTAPTTKKKQIREKINSAKREAKNILKKVLILSFYRLLKNKRYLAGMTLLL
jgi:hypothetical protein